MGSSGRPGMEFELDDIGPWSEQKLEIVAEYAAAYAKIFGARKQRTRFDWWYIDGFAGAGLNVSRETGAIVSGVGS